MHRHLTVFPISFALLFSIITDLAAQSAISTPPELSKRALRQQDRQICNKLANELKVATSNLTYFVRECMADRQALRKSAAKQKSN